MRSGKRMVLIGGALIVLVLAVAWLDGGEEPLHPIVVAIETPESLR